MSDRERVLITDALSPFVRIFLRFLKNEFYDLVQRTREHPTVT